MVFILKMYLGRVGRKKEEKTVRERKSVLMVADGNMSSKKCRSILVAVWHFKAR